MLEQDNNYIKILIADDECDITNSIAYALKRENYEVEVAYDGEEALNKIEAFNPHILILDIMMPKYNGYDICNSLKTDHNMGILMLTARAELEDKILGLELGADDYVTKPFDLIELLARVKSMARRLKKALNLSKDKANDLNKVEVKIKERKILVDKIDVEFKPKEFELLLFLLKNKNIVFSREKILEEVWSLDYIGSTRTVDKHIQRIRKKLGAYGDSIVTVPKIGYKLIDLKGCFN